MNQTTLRKRHFFAFYIPNSEAIKSKHQGRGVIAFTCIIARENWIEFINRDTINSGRGILAHRTTSIKARNYLGMDKGDVFMFSPISSESIYFHPELSDQTYYLTDVNRL